MFRKRNLVALLMAAMLSLGIVGAAFAEDGGSTSLPMPSQDQQHQIEAGSVWA